MLQSFDSLNIILPYRYKKLSRIEEERKVMILNHLGFLQCPTPDRCYYKEMCVDHKLTELLESPAFKYVLDSFFQLC